MSDQCGSCAAACRRQVGIGRAAWDDRHIFTVCLSARSDDRRCTQTTEARTPSVHCLHQAGWAASLQLCRSACMLEPLYQLPVARKHALVPAWHLANVSYITGSGRLQTLNPIRRAQATVGAGLPVIAIPIIKPKLLTLSGARRRQSARACR